MTDFSTLLIEAGTALARVPQLELDLASAEGRIAELLRSLSETTSKLDTANAQIATLTKRRGTFEIDMVFNSDRMCWYGRLRDSLSRYGTTVRQIAQTGKPESIGFTVRDYVELLAWTLRTTGDVWLRDEIASVMNIVRDRTDFNPTTYKDITFLTSLYALTAYVLCSGETPHPDGAYWKQKALEACVTSVPGDNIMHPYTASCLTAWLMWLLTGEDRFRVDAEVRRDELRRSITLLESGRAVWFHRPKFAESKDYGRSIPRTAYARYVIADLMLMLVLGFEVISAAALVKTVEFLTEVSANIYYWLDGEMHQTDTGLDVQFDPPKLTTSNFFVMSDALRQRFALLTYSTPHIPAALVGDE